MQPDVFEIVNLFVWTDAIVQMDTLAFSYQHSVEFEQQKLYKKTKTNFWTNTLQWSKFYYMFFSTLLHFRLNCISITNPERDRKTKTITWQSDNSYNNNNNRNGCICKWWDYWMRICKYSRDKNVKKKTSSSPGDHRLRQFSMQEYFEYILFILCIHFVWFSYLFGHWHPSHWEESNTASIFI